MKTLVLPPRYTEDSSALSKAAGRAGWAVVEANPAWGSGIYGCDPAVVLKVVERSCVKVSLLQPADAQWIIDHESEDFR